MDRLVKHVGIWLLAPWRCIFHISQPLYLVCACVQVEGPHPVAVMMDRLEKHVSMVATIMMLHPDDFLNKVRLLDHSTMELTDSNADQVGGSGYRVQG
jgi:hypothetical protein